MKLFRNIGKKILIICTCIMLVVAPNIKNSKAFLLVDDAVVVAVLGGLCALGGVMLINDSFRDSASDFLSNAVDSYVDYYGGLATDAYDKVKEIATNIYNTGAVAVSDFNNWLHGWFGNFINGYVLPTYPIVGSVSSPIFSFTDKIFYGTDVPTSLLNSPHGITSDTVGIYGVGSSSFPVYFDGTYNNHFKISIVGNVISCFLSQYNGGYGLSTKNFEVNDFNLYITGLMDGIVEFDNGTFAYYHYATNTWSRDMEGQLELDPNLFNKDTMGDIDIAPPFTDGLLDNSLDYTNYWVLGGDTAFDNTGDMTFPGTIDVPLDYPYTGVYEQDYPYVIEGDYPIVDDIPKDTVVDTYPDYPITTTPTDTDYKADWSTVFPFCIPFDLFRFLNLLSATPKTPKFEFDYNFWGMKGTFEVDLAFMNGFASICRTGFDILFILGLAMVTRDKLIKA